MFWKKSDRAFFQKEDRIVPEGNLLVEHSGSMSAGWISQIALLQEIRKRRPGDRDETE